MPSFSNFADFENYLNTKINKSVESACKRILDELQKIIVEEYYDQYNPKQYVREYLFLQSATTKMLDQITGMVFMDEDVMNYPGDWDGERQLAYASEGYHGRLSIRTDGRFWDTFVEFMKNNALIILKEEMKKQGIPLK